MDSWLSVFQYSRVTPASWPDPQVFPVVSLSLKSNQLWLKRLSALIILCHLTWEFQNLTSQKGHIRTVFLECVQAFTVWFIIVLSFSNWHWPPGNFPACGARLGPHFTCCKSQMVICNLPCQACERRFSLVISKHSAMFKIGQVHSVDPGPSEIRDPWAVVLLWSEPFVPWDLTWLQLEKRKWFVVLDLKMVPGSHFPSWHDPKCQPHYLEQIHQKICGSVYF